MRKAAAALAFLALAACSKPHPPEGKWEGGYASNGTLVAARVEITADGLVKISAPDITNMQTARPERLQAIREELAADLVAAWDTVTPRPFDFDGKTFRKPGEFAPQMKWDKSSNQMTLELYIGANPALPIPLRPVDVFHDNPWPAT
ncbi:MAG: hypothetical protein J0I19_13380 [Alphaproteobacteria bacterium]|nr:hypothetical protein [Alphaproteobacteria bacterium]